VKPLQIELLQRMPVFGAIREDTLHFLLDRVQEVYLDAGQFFFREGDRAESMYVLEAGKVAVLKGWRGNEFLLHYLQAGDCFGEMALLDLFPRSASIRAETACEAMALGGTDLYRLFEHDAEQFALIQMNIGREISRRLRLVDDLLFRARVAGEVPAPAELVLRST
jgi:CRP/FNR family cyclic AMP-dependent transcriptional regulator